MPNSDNEICEYCPKTRAEHRAENNESTFVGSGRYKESENNVTDLYSDPFGAFSSGGYISPPNPTVDPLPEVKDRIAEGDEPDVVQEAVIEERIATERELLQFCQVVRKIGGGEIIQELLPGVPGNAEKCLIAKNLNFECKVAPRFNLDDGDSVNFNPAEKRFRAQDWVMHAPADVLAKIASELGLELVPQKVPFGDVGIALVLPRYIGNSASAFDKGVAFKQYASYNI